LPDTESDLTDLQICTGDGGERAKGRCNELPKISILAKTESLSLMGPFPQDNFEISPILQPRSSASPALCSGPEPAEKGHERGSTRSAFGYQHYINAAACFIYNRYMAVKSQQL